MSRTKRGRRRRVFVLEAMATRLIEILGATLVPALGFMYLSRLTHDRYRSLAAVLDLIGATFAVFPLAMALAILVWSAFPEKDDGGWLSHPARLWPPTIITIAFTIVLVSSLINSEST